MSVYQAEENPRAKTVVSSFNQSEDLIVLFLNMVGIHFVLVLQCPFLRKQQ